jgi:Tfp pilus assembly protein PilN
MIKINLLPDEYRRKNRTPLKLMLAVSAGVAANSVLLSWYAWLAFGVAAEIESERAVLQTELDGLNPQVTYHKSLEGEQKRYAAREKTLGAITASRINWTRKVDELITIINSGGEGERHFVWLDDLTVMQTTSARANTAGSFKASGHSGSDNFAQVANFLEDLERSSFIEDFLPPAPPEGTQTLVDNDLIPPVVWAFPLALDLKTPEERQQK